MLASDNHTQKQNTTVEIHPRDLERLMQREWLLTNSRGGFSSGTLANCNTRRYHGLLTGSLNPPANRVMTLSCCREVIHLDQQDSEMCNMEFDGELSDKAIKNMKRFIRDGSVHFDYDFGAAEVTKSIHLLPDSDTVALVYDFYRVHEPFKFTVRPLVAMRDFHALQKSQTSLRAVERNKSWAIRTDAGYTGELILQCSQMNFKPDSQWWYNFMYRKDKDRGQDCLEDLWSPGHYYRKIDSPVKLVIWASLMPALPIGQEQEDIQFDLDIALDAIELKQQESIPRENSSKDDTFNALCRAASQFVVERNICGRLTPTVLAGYPWFLDWGRDTFISLPGLLLSTGRFEDAAGVLTTFGSAVDEGMIPNRFDDYGNDPHYNSIDASLWYVHSAFEYLRVTDDIDTFSARILPAVRKIIESYRRGTRFGIHADADGLITGGDPQTQLTWMDARCCGVTFTPRYGKAVEINALWYNALRNLADYYNRRNNDESNFYRELADRVEKSFSDLFWNPAAGYLNDCILPDGTVDSSLRPNQIYSVSLPHSPLSLNHQQRVVDVIERNLLTPYGLRTLSSQDPRYCRYYQGSQMERDGAYHQGTVWSHLMGPFIEAFLRINKFDKVSKLEANDFLKPLLDHMFDSGCFGSISEIFDGDHPHHPKGCFAQAWSVAETLRAYMLINRS